jgi:hypothetical protein
LVESRSDLRSALTILFHAVAKARLARVRVRVRVSVRVGVRVGVGVGVRVKVRVRAKAVARHCVEQASSEGCSLCTPSFRYLVGDGVEE